MNNYKFEALALALALAHLLNVKHPLPAGVPPEHGSGTVAGVVARELADVGPVLPDVNAPEIADDDVEGSHLDELGHYISVLGVDRGADAAAANEVRR